MKVALVYDRLNKWGGAERILLALHKIFPDAPLYTSLRDVDATPWADVFDVRTSFLNIPFMGQRNDIFAPLMPGAFEGFNFDEYDLVISVTSEAAKGVITKGKTKHLCYCLTPTRYLWSGYDEYFKDDVLRILSKPVVGYLRKWDLVAAKRPDKMLAISSEVKKRIKTYYKRDSEVLFPPVMIKRSKTKKSNKKYFLYVQRMSKYNQYKKADLVIEAFNQTGQKLKVVGRGPLLSSLKKNANKNIEFMGEVDDTVLSDLYTNAQALVYAGIEDFGLVMAEALYCETPVIAYKNGGALDIVVEGKTGTFFEDQSVSSLVAALQRFKASSYNRAVIKDYSERFSFENFEKSLKEHIKNL